MTTYGLEIEGRKKLSELLSVYANYSFNRAESDSDEAKGGLSNDNDRLLNYPSHISNIGLDISLEERVTLNANLYLWRDMKVIKSIRETDSFGEFARIDGEEYLDVTLVLLSPFGLPARLNIYANNILDNDERVGLVTNGGYYYPIGRNIGAGITYRF